MTKVEKTMEIQVSPANLLEAAVVAGQSPESLKMLMDLYDRWKADKAKMAFHNALKIFQESVGPIKRTSEMYWNGKMKFKYAGLGEVMTAIKPALAKAELTVRWVNEDVGTKLKVTCFVTHIAGHSESTCMEGEPDVSGGKNAIQSKGSTLTYLQRYTVSMALGIVTEDDTDGNPPDKTEVKKPEPGKKKVPTEKQLVEMRARIEAGVPLEKVKEFFELTPEMEAKLME